MRLPSVFTSPVAYREAFVAGLERQLAEPGLGTYILVLANACFDPAIWPRLRQPLAARFQSLAEEVRAALRGGGRLAYPEDDLVVFLKLMAMGFEHMAVTESRSEGPWRLQFNPLRALRPARASGQRVAGCLPPAFNPQGFQFNKPFLRPEILWEGRLGSHDARLLYNKFPFTPLHGLLVPDPGRELPQRLEQEYHYHAWHLMEALGSTLPGALLAYNSYGAQASVNHLHFQLALPEAPLPLAAARWRHNGGGEDYPAVCRAYADATEAWIHLDALHAAGQPYNLVYTPGRLYCLPRRPQGSHTPAPWAGGHAWYEMAGGVVAFSRDDYLGLTATELAAELARA